MDDLHFLRPIWLWSLIPATLLWWGLWRSQDQTEAWKKVIDPHLLQHLLVGEEQRRRFAADIDERNARGLLEPTVDGRFLAALEAGLPDCAGVALRG